MALTSYCDETLIKCWHTFWLTYQFMVSLNFLYSLGKVLPTVGLALQHQLMIRQSPKDMPIGQSDLGNPWLRPLLPYTLGCVKVTIKVNRTEPNTLILFSFSL